MFQRTFDDFSTQKNAAIGKASYDWIVFFDPDEKITKQLSQEILSTLKNPKAIAYYVNREFHFMGKQIKFSGLQNDNVIRLFNKNYCAYNDNPVMSSFADCYVFLSRKIIKGSLKHLYFFMFLSDGQC